ncbi:MAG: glycosyl transferase, partial [Methanosaeta sp. SDB]
MENYVHNLSKELVEMGHEVTVLCANEPESKEEEFIDGIKVQRVPYIGKIANTNITPRLPIEILREDFDVIHTHLPTPWSADWSAVASALMKRPLVLTYYNDIVGEGFAKRLAQLYNRTNLKFLLRQASKIIIIQPEYLESSSHLEGFDKKVEAIPVGVDLKRFRPLENDADGNTLFFLSVLDRYHGYKGLEELLRALVVVRETVPDVKLIVGGGGELLNHYRSLSDHLHLEENVEFLGFVPEEMVAKYYNRCDIFLLPSISKAQEGFGMVLLEAMACGKPVICTEIAGVADDVMARGVGLTVDHANQDELVEAISYLL